MTSSQNTQRETTPGISKVTDLDQEFQTDVKTKRKLVFEIDTPAIRADSNGHKVDLRSTEFYQDESKRSKFEKEFGYRGSDSSENRKYMKDNGLANWNRKTDEIPNLENIDIVDKKLVETVIAEESWHNSQLAMENLLLQAYYHKLPPKYTDKLEAAILEAPAYDYTKPQDRDMSYKNEATSEYSERFLGFIDLQDKKLVQLVIDTESYPNNKIALENLIKNAKRLELEDRYIEKIERALLESPKITYIKPEVSYKYYRAGTDKKEDSLDRSLEREYAPELIEADKRLISFLIETESYHKSRIALENLLLRAKKLGIDQDLISKTELVLESMPEQVRYLEYSPPAKRKAFPNIDYLDGVLDDSRKFAEDVKKADEKLTILVVRTKSLPESLTALATYLPYISKLKVGSVFKLNKKKAGESFELTITEEEKMKYKDSILDKAKEILKEQTLQQLEKTYYTLGISEKYLPIRNEIIRKINELLPDDAEGLANELIDSTNRDAKAVYRKLILKKANTLGIYDDFENALGDYSNFIDRIDEDIKSWQKPEARITQKKKNVKEGHQVDRSHKEYKVDSVPMSGMTMSQVTEDGVVFKEMVGHFGESSEAMEYLREHNLKLWKSALKGEIPDLDVSKAKDIELLATAFRQDSTHKSKLAIENYLMQIIKTVPGLLKYALEHLPDEWKSDTKNIEDLSSRASDYHNLYTCNHLRKNETILDILEDFKKENIDFVQEDSKEGISPIDFGINMDKLSLKEQPNTPESSDLKKLIDQIAGGSVEDSVIDLGMLQQIAKLAKKAMPGSYDHRPDSIISDVSSASSNSDSASHRDSFSSSTGLIGENTLSLIISTEC